MYWQWCLDELKPWAMETWSKAEGVEKVLCQGPIFESQRGFFTNAADKYIPHGDFSQEWMNECAQLYMVVEAQIKRDKQAALQQAQKEEARKNARAFMSAEEAEAAARRDAAADAAENRARQGATLSPLIKEFMDFVLDVMPPKDNESVHAEAAASAQVPESQANHDKDDGNQDRIDPKRISMRDLWKRNHQTRFGTSTAFQKSKRAESVARRRDIERFLNAMMQESQYHETDPEDGAFYEMGSTDVHEP